MTENLRKRQGRDDSQSNALAPTSSKDTARPQVLVLKEQPTTALDAIALTLGLTLVALLFNTLAPHSYMVSIFLLEMLSSIALNK